MVISAHSGHCVYLSISKYKISENVRLFCLSKFMMVFIDCYAFSIHSHVYVYIRGRKLRVLNIN